MIGILDEAEKELNLAAAEITGRTERLDRLMVLLTSLPALLANCPEDQREALRARLAEFNRKVRVFGEVVDRGNAFLEGYARNAGLRFNTYAPGGSFTAPSETESVSFQG
jgi:hypothetical protein